MEKLYVLMITLALIGPAQAADDAKGPKTKQVCNKVKGKEVCKTIKIHKKVEGTPVPQAKKK